MARLFIGSDEAALERVRASWERAEMPAGAAFAHGGVHVATARKRVGRHVNAVTEGPSRWIVGVGTFATFDGRVGEAALRALLAAFDPDDPFAVRGLVFGHYTLAVASGDRVWVLGDEVESYDAIWWRDPGDPGRFAVGTMLLEVAEAAASHGSGGAITPLAAFKATYNGERGVSGRTAVPGVMALRGHEALAIETDPPRLRVLTPPRPPRAPRGGEEGDLIEDYLARSERVMSVLPRFGTVGLNLTGGLDSRLLAAEVSARGVAPVVLYGRGDSAMTNTRAQDERIARDVAAFEGWPFVRMDWRQAVPHDREARRGLRERHGLKQLYGGTSGLTRAMEGDIDPYPDVQIGAYTPPLTNYKPWERGEGDVSLADLAASLPGNLAVLRTPAARRAHLAELEEDLRELARVHGMTVHGGRLTRADHVRLLMHVRRSKDAFNIVAFNQFGRYLAPLFTTDLYDALADVPAEMRRGDRFQLAVIEALDPDLLAFPVFSFITPFDVDREALTMTARPKGQGSVPARAKRAVEARLPLGVRRRLRTTRGMATRPADKSWAFRAALHRELRRDHPKDEVCPARLCEEDLRVAYRYLNLLEASAELGRPA